MLGSQRRDCAAGFFFVEPLRVNFHFCYQRQNEIPKGMETSL